MSLPYVFQENPFVDLSGKTRTFFAATWTDPRGVRCRISCENPRGVPGSKEYEVALALFLLGGETSVADVCDKIRVSRKSKAKVIESLSRLATSEYEIDGVFDELQTGFRLLDIERVGKGRATRYRYCFHPLLVTGNAQYVDAAKLFALPSARAKRLYTLLDAYRKRTDDGRHSRRIDCVLRLLSCNAKRRGDQFRAVKNAAKPLVGSGYLESFEVGDTCHFVYAGEPIAVPEERDRTSVAQLEHGPERATAVVPVDDTERNGPTYRQDSAPGEDFAPADPSADIEKPVKKEEKQTQKEGSEVISENEKKFREAVTWLRGQGLVDDDWPYRIPRERLIANFPRVRDEYHHRKGNFRNPIGWVRHQLTMSTERPRTPLERTKKSFGCSGSSKRCGSPPRASMGEIEACVGKLGVCVRSSNNIWARVQRALEDDPTAWSRAVICDITDCIARENGVRLDHVGTVLADNYEAIKSLWPPNIVSFLETRDSERLANSKKETAVGKNTFANPKRTKCRPQQVGATNTWKNRENPGLISQAKAVKREIDDNNRRDLEDKQREFLRVLREHEEETRDNAPVWRARAKMEAEKLRLPPQLTWFQERRILAAMVVRWLTEVNGHVFREEIVDQLLADEVCRIVRKQ